MISQLTIWNKCTLIFCFLTSCIIPTMLTAQILKVNKSNMTADTANVWAGHVTLDFGMNNRNSTAESQVTFTSLKTLGDISYSSEKHIYYIIGDVRYFKSTGGPLLSTGYAHFRTNFLRKKKLSYESFAQIQYDQGRNLDSRALAGIGVKYRITDHLSIGTGIMEEYERWQLLENDHQFIDKTLTKSSSYITGKTPIGNQAQLSITGYYQTGWDLKVEALRNRFSVDTALDFKFNEQLAFRIAYAIAYEDRPIIPISKSNYSLSNGLKFTF